MDKKEAFLRKYAAAAVAAGKRFKLNPVVILAQAAHESGWGTSYSAQHRHNLFGIMAAGSPNEFWHGLTDAAKAPPPRLFRVYDTDTNSLLDFARLISTKPAYAPAYGVSYAPDLYAKAIAASPYISEANGDNRAQYAQAVAANAAWFKTRADALKISLTY